MNRIEDNLKKLIFRDVKFVLNSKTIREGKIQLFNTKQNFLKFKIEDDGETKEWEVSYPYDIKTIKNGFIFDYSLSAFCPRTEEVYWRMKAINKKDASKFFDNYLYVLTS
jgi:hypothetical protein